MGEKQNGYIQEYETLAKVISIALGGESKDKEPPIPQSLAEAQVMMSKIFARK